MQCVSAGSAADGPESDGVTHRTPARFLLDASSAPRARALAAAAALVVLWAIVYPRTPDLAAAFYRVDLFRQLGLAVWDEHWYAGHHLVAYSVLFPPLASALGLRVLGCACVLASVALFGQIAADAYGRRGGAAAALFALAAVADVWVGRVAFALGVALALAAFLSFRRGHAGAAGLLAALSAAASPVAAGLLALAGLTQVLVSRSARPALALCVPPALVIGALALLFGEGGFEPFPILSFLPTTLVTCAFAIALPARERALRAGALLYLACCVLALLVHTPVGSNLERYGVLLAGPLLLCARLSSGGSPRGALTLARAFGARGTVALLAWAVWCAWGPVRETVAVAGNPSTSAAYYAPVREFVAQLGGQPVRIEVPLTRSHWEAALLANTVSLARGWEKQLDERYDGVLLGHHLDAASYRRWLAREAVAYVALPDAPLDHSSQGEGRLIRGGLSYLREVSSSAHWKIYAVLGAPPIVSGPGSLTTLAHDAFALRADAPGRFLVRVHFTRYFAVDAGRACVRGAPEGWTEVRVREPGAVTVRARFSLARALGDGGECR
jgi:hypothetical protein